eukprot:scaffold421295_cov60-Attheya_sp.AAC.1
MAHEEYDEISEGNDQGRTARLIPVKIADSLTIDSSDKNKFPYPAEYEGQLGSVMISYDDIIARTAQLARLINEDYKNERPVLICVLKGASPDLKQGFTFEFMRAKSYVGDSSSGSVNITGLDYSHLEGKACIIVEDIVDTGLTLSQVIPALQNEGNPKSLRVCTLLEKRISVQRHPEAETARMAIADRYVGFSIPDQFIIGYGLDFNELYRDLKDIWVISELGIQAGGNI